MPDTFDNAWQAILDRLEFYPLDSVLRTSPAIVHLTDRRSGMTLLHLACGVDNLSAAKILVERGAQFTPDRQGRMPSIIAAECESSEELCDFIAEAEARAEQPEQAQHLTDLARTILQTQDPTVKREDYKA